MQWKPNATVAAIAEKDGKFLLVEEKVNDELVFNQPAGHLEHNETIFDAVKREVLEETAWEFEPEYLVGVYLYPNPNNPDISYLRFSFYGHCTNEHKGQPLDDGIVRAVWLSREEIENQRQRMRSPLVEQCIDDYLKGNRYPLDIIHHAI